MYKIMEQVEKEFDGQWVFMVNCKQNERGTLLGGEVVLNSESRAKVVRNMRAADNGDSLTFIGYVGSNHSNKNRTITRLFTMARENCP